jgi:hypothetical protein
MNTPPRKNGAAGTSSAHQERNGTWRPTSAGPSPTESDTDMTGTYVRVVILEAVIIAALWLLGRAFS